MAEKPSTEERYDKLVKAVSGGEVAMVRYLWETMERFEGVVEETPQSKLERMKKEVDTLLKKLRDNPPKDGTSGRPGRPGHDGKDGKDGRDGRPGRDGRDGQDGTAGHDGKDGKDGEMPEHEWEGSRIRFMQPDGEWGAWVDLRGAQGLPGQSYGPDGGGLPHSPVTVRKGNSRFEGVSEIVFSDNLTVTKTTNGVSVSSAAGGSGSGLSSQAVSGTINGSNKAFTISSSFTGKSWIVLGQTVLMEDVHYTVSGTNITYTNAPHAGLSGQPHRIYHG